VGLLITNYQSGDQIKKNELAGHVTRMGDRRAEYRVLVGKQPERKRLLERPRRRWVDNIKMNL